MSHLKKIQQMFENWMSKDSCDKCNDYSEFSFFDRDVQKFNRFCFTHFDEYAHSLGYTCDIEQRRDGDPCDYGCKVVNVPDDLKKLSEDSIWFCEHPPRGSVDKEGNCIKCVYNRRHEIGQKCTEEDVLCQFGCATVLMKAREKRERKLIKS